MARKRWNNLLSISALCPEVCVLEKACTWKFALLLMADLVLARDPSDHLLLLDCEGLG